MACFWTDKVLVIEECDDGPLPATDWTGSMINGALVMLSPTSFVNPTSDSIAGDVDLPPGFQAHRIVYGEQLNISVGDSSVSDFSDEYGDDADTYTGFIRDLTIYQLNISTGAVIDSENLGDFALSHMEPINGRTEALFQATIDAPAAAYDDGVAWAAHGVIDMTSSGSGTPINAPISMRYIHHDNEAAVRVDNSGSWSSRVFPLDVDEINVTFQSDECTFFCDDPSILDIEVNSVPDTATIAAVCI